MATQRCDQARHRTAQPNAHFHHRLDPQLMGTIVSVLEPLISERGIVLRPEKKGQLLALVYERLQGRGATPAHCRKVVSDYLDLLD
ncbi:MAG TPA: hypothetical protein VFA48_06520 [Gammaproteobacteria bacterium]|nr:hypothetical protein [Gammaproteobacteria bacterium]